MKIRRLVGLAALAAQVSFAAGVRSVEDVTAYGAVGDGRTDDTAAILKAEAAAWESGKPLFFPTNGVGSTYLTRKGVILVSGMTLTADRGAVLANASAVLQGGGRTLRIRLAKSAEKGDGVLALESTDGLVPGQEVTIYDTAKGGGYSETQADIASVDPAAGTVTIDTGRYSADDRNRGLFSRMSAGSACVLTDFSLVKTVQRKGRDAENVIVENITVRPYGNPGDPYVYTISPIAETAQNRPSRQGHFIVRNVTVDGSMQDGISTQGAGDIWIENCTVRRVKHKGLHWGTTCDRVIIRGNLCEDCGSAEYEKTSANGGTGGMYFCYNNHRVIIVGNTLRRCYKGVFGFSGNEVGASDTDSIVADNLFDDCALAGIRLEAGLHINVTGNRFVNFTGGGVPILTVREWDGLQYSIVSDNVCEGFRSGGAAVRNPIDLTYAVGTVARNNAVTPELRPLPPVAAPPAWRAPTDGEEDVTAYGAVGDGRTDDTAAIARAIAAAQASGRPVLFPKTAGGSVYCVTEPVVLASKLDVRAFPLATVRSATTALVIRGREVTVENLGVHSLSNDAIVVERSEDVRLRHIRVEGAAENGLVVKGGARITLEDALVRQARRFGVRLTDGCAKVTLVANLFASCGDAKKGTGGCLEFAGSEEALVTCNHLADSPYGLFGSGAGDERATVSLNTFSRLSVAGALLGGGRGLRFYGNRFLRFARKAVPFKAVSPADGRPFRESVIEANGIASFEGAKLRKKANPDAYVNEEGAIVLKGAKDVKVVGNCLRADTTVHDPANPNTPSGSVEIRVTDSTGCTVAENVVSPVCRERGMNFDETKVRPYDLEDPLTFADGRRATRETWPARRQEILDVFAHGLFGVEPPRPEVLEIEASTNAVVLAGLGIRRRYRLTFRKDRSGPCVEWTVWLPNRPQKVADFTPTSEPHPASGAPVVLFLNYGGDQNLDLPADNRRHVPLQAILARGYAVMTADYQQISPDDVNTMCNGVLSLWPRTGDDAPRSLGAWAWGLSRGLDLAEGIPEIDATKAVVTGSSRLGKAALLAGARDARFAVVVPVQTGKGGVPLWKRDFGENLSMFFRSYSASWFLPSLVRYAGDETKLPFDMHALLAAVAPRRLLVQGFATESFDPRGEFLALEAASPVWEMLTGTGLPHVPFPAPYDASAVGQRVGYVRRGSFHGISALDWKWTLDFADAAFAESVSDEPAGVLDELLPRPRTLRRLPGCASSLAAGAAVRGPVPGVPADRQEEAYRLTADAWGVRILSGGRLGDLHARATLEQLRRLAAKDGSVPAFELTDWPEIPLRGLMLDTGRNFVELAALKDVIDHLSLYKMNVFHWHLTDFHGWRLESKRHPALNGDKATTRFPGRFYTQAQFRELVDYAWTRGVTVVPELDVPGHTKAFRLGMGVEKMREEKVRGAVLDLIDELCSLVPAERMPYVHLGTDEVDRETKGGVEWVPKEWIAAWADRVASHGRTLWGWQPGERIESKGPQLKEIWGWVDYHRNEPAWTAGFGEVPYVDSTEFAYVNHIDPFELLNAAAFQKPCPWGPRTNRCGVMISAWHDDAIAESEDYFRQVMVFPAVTMYSDAFWCGRERHEIRYFARLPKPGTVDFAFAADMERRTLAQRDKVLKDLRHPFAYVAQTQMRWRLSTADGKTVATDIPQGTVYPNRTLFSGSYLTNETGTAVLETWIRSPREQTVPFWIGFTAFARSGGRFVDGPVPSAGAWNRHGATVELNGSKVPAPAWAHAGLGGEVSRETPAVDEEYFYRAPTALPLRAGWNHVKLTLPKGPQEDPGQKWVGTFVPVAGTSEHPREFPGLDYSARPQP